MRVAASWRRQDHPPVDEERREAGVWTGIFGAGRRMAGNEMNGRRHVRRDIGDDRRFGATDVGDDGARLHVRRDRGGDGAHCADGGAQDDEVRALDRSGDVVRGRRRRAQSRARGSRRPRRRRRRRSFVRGFAPARHGRSTRQSGPSPMTVNRSKRGEESGAPSLSGISRPAGPQTRQPRCLAKAANASMTRRFATSPPTLRRRHSGRP